MSCRYKRYLFVRCENYGWKIAQEKDPAKKNALIDDLMGVYDKRVKYFGNDRRYGKDWIVARKVQDYLAQTGDNADYNQAYTWLKEIVDEKGADTEALGLSLFSFSSMKKMLNDPNFKEQYIQDYLKVSAGLDAQLKAAQAANNQKEVNALSANRVVLIMPLQIVVLPIARLCRICMLLRSRRIRITYLI